MLVFISDIHLTYGKTRKSIPPKAFKRFVQVLEEMATHDTINAVEVVLLGDIFDVIRSWPSQAVKPWTGWKTGKKSKKLEEVTKNIVKDIIYGGPRRDKSRKLVAPSDNAQSIDHLIRFKNEMEEKNKNVQYTYIVGNHDWLVNRYPDTRVMVAEALKMKNPRRYRTNRFPVEKTWEEYGVFARHGDRYDPFNFEEDRDASSLGDVIIVELVNKFARDVEEKLGPPEENPLSKQLREIDNVRPLMDIPAWIAGVCNRSGSVEDSKKVKNIWNKLADDFVRIDFVKKRDDWWNPWDSVDKLQAGLRISEHLSIKFLADLPFKSLLMKKDDYARHAFDENALKSRRADTVVYGHTHHYEIRPLDQFLISGGFRNQMYFNTGTWRQVHVRTAQDRRNYEFASWYVMTFVVFYLPGEREDGRKFEVWSGALA